MHRHRGLLLRDVALADCSVSSFLCQRGVEFSGRQASESLYFLRVARYTLTHLFDALEHTMTDQDRLVGAGKRPEDRLDYALRQPGWTK